MSLSKHAICTCALRSIIVQSRAHGPSDSYAIHICLLSSCLSLACPYPIQIGAPGLCRVLPIHRQIWELNHSTHIMGILNLTPDSFSDGGKYLGNTGAAVESARQLYRAGAQSIDVGGQSTRPGSTPVSPEEELARVIPVIR